VLTEDLPKTLDILADIIMAPLFPEDELSKIKQLTLQRIQSQDDHWGRELGNRFRENFYKVHPYGNNPLGSETSLKKISKKDIQGLFTKLVVGKNLVIGVFGDIPSDIEEQIVKRFSSVPDKEYNAGTIPQEPELKESKRLVFESKSPQIAGVFVGYQGISYKDVKKSSTLDVIDAMTSGRGFPGGWLHTSLRGAQLVYVVHAFNVSGLDPGYFGIYAGCSPPNVEKVEKLIFREMDRLAKGEFSDKELKEAQHLCIMNEILNHQTPGQYAFRETIDTVYKLGHDFYKGYEKRINKVTRDDIINTAKELFKHHVMVVNLPKSFMQDKNENK
jgi:zinc protease